MASRSSTFKQADITRAAKAVVAAGLNVASIEVNRDGKIVILTAGSDKVEERNDWDAG